MAFSSVSLNVSFSTSETCTVSFSIWVTESVFVIFCPTLWFSFLGDSPQETIKNNSKLAVIADSLNSMNFKEFCELALKLKNLPLPGEYSHHKMSPRLRIQWLKENNIADANPRQAGVMALFYPDMEEETRLLLILRKAYEGVHSNQIGFPGGKVEKVDRNLLDTALRETYEEVGVEPKAVEVIKELSEVYIPPSNFLVRPFMGIYPNPKPFVKEENEVEQIVEVYLKDFLDEKNLIMEQLSTSYAKNINVPAYRLNGYTVWGATAMMMSEIRELLRQAL